MAPALPHLSRLGAMTTPEIQTALHAETFAELGIADDLFSTLKAEGIIAPFAIQALVIPDALAGKDVCGKAKTGAGKTLAFGLPIVQSMETARPKRPRALVLVPTRELCNQVTEVLGKLTDARGMHLTSVYGGVAMSTQTNALNKGVEVVVATPGRLIDLMDRKAVFLDDVSIVTIDEADQMADMGFLPQVRRIMSDVPENRQTMLFSATLDGQVGALIQAYMHDPVYHEVASTTQMVDTMEHRFIKVHHMDKARVAAAIANSAERTLMFVRTKASCDDVARKLREEGVNATAIHGDRQQRHREKALEDFASGKTPVLVATNVAARGLHVEGVDIVIHFDPPDDPKTYLHRSGRTARAGESGLVVTLVRWDEVNEVIGIQRRAGLNVPIIKMFSNDERLKDLTSWEPPKDQAPIRSAAKKSLATRRRKRF